jgi:hypothetical protein
MDIRGTWEIHRGLGGDAEHADRTDNPEGGGSHGAKSDR